MDISGISSNDPAPTSVGQSALGGESIDTGSFLELFVAQLQNQDPLNPIENEQFVEQLATISSLEQLEDMNANMLSMMALNQSNALLSQLTQSSALIGSTVNWVDPSTGAITEGVVDTVKILEGLAVLQVDGRDVPLALVTEILNTGSEETAGGSTGETASEDETSENETTQE